MLIISGKSLKQQMIGRRNAPCAACGQETPHRLQRSYAVKHVFWFPLFSYHTTYAKLCERCNLYTDAPEPAPGTVPPKPLLHRIGFVFPLGFILGPFVLFPFALMFAAGTGAASGGATQADTAYSALHRFRADDADRAAQSEVRAYFDRMGLRVSSVAAKSAAAAGHKVRLLTVQYGRLGKVSDGDRVRLLESMEQIADKTFPDDEVFLGLEGRILWGGHSHRKAGDDWRRIVDGSTPNPETDAGAALRALEAAAAAATTKTPPTTVAATADAGPKSTSEK